MGFKPTTSESELLLHPKSSGIPAEVRTHGLVHAVNKHNHQTKRLTSANSERTRGLRSSYANIFFPGSSQGVTGRFFAAIGGVQFSLFSRGLFLHKKNLIRSNFSCFDRGMKRSRTGSSSPTNKLKRNPPKSF